jgi:hypothetical protein
MKIINNKNLYSKNSNINKSYISLHESNETSSDIIIHNDILDLYITYVKQKKLLSLKYFKTLLPLYYKIIFHKSLIYKNINYDIVVQEDLFIILNDYSFINLYKIILYYMNDEHVNVTQLTAMFYSTLYYTTKETVQNNESD